MTSYVCIQWNNIDHQVAPYASLYLAGLQICVIIILKHKTDSCTADRVTRGGKRSADVARVKIAH